MTTRPMMYEFRFWYRRKGIVEADTALVIYAPDLDEAKAFWRANKPADNAGLERIELPPVLAT